MLTLFATTPRGVEGLLAEELKQLGAISADPTRGGVRATGDLEFAYRCCLWSRLANRLLLPLGTWEVQSPDELYAAVQSIDWTEQLRCEQTIAVSASLVQSTLNHSRYAEQKVKDAVVDQMRDKTGARPTVDTRNPDVRLNLHLLRDQATLSLDLAGESLHRRGYRADGGPAPIKENLAAVMLWRAGWQDMVAAGSPLLDAMCGSGTLLLEGAMMAGDIAPGLLRQTFGFESWVGHNDQLWKSLQAEADERARIGRAALPPLFGYDRSPRAIAATKESFRLLGLSEAVTLKQQSVAELRNPFPDREGLIVVNPPYAERLGEKSEVAATYFQLGERLRAEFSGWRLALLTGDLDLARVLPFRPDKKGVLEHGGEQRHLLQFSLVPERSVATGDDGGAMLANRLRKNLRRLKSWRKRDGVSCFRLYDRDLPEYAVAIDQYEDWLHVQEFAAPASIDPNKAQRRLAIILSVLPDVTGVPAEQIVLKTRQRQRGSEQYRKLDGQGGELEAREGRYRFGINLQDYIDTGLFLDHRPTRALIERLAEGRSFLNLFCYTGSATVYAAGGGAVSSDSVDMSRPYLDWARQNLSRNGLGSPRHRFIQADCLQWLEQEKKRYDLIFLDPPTFSNSKRMSQDFSVQQDHTRLVELAMKRLTPGGLLLFSTNARRFKLDLEPVDKIEIIDLTQKTTPPDFPRGHAHQCWLLAADAQALQGLPI